MSDPYPCDGCGEAGSEVTKWMSGPYGLSAVHVHDNEECATTAKEKRGGGRWVVLGPAKGVVPKLPNHDTAR